MSIKMETSSPHAQLKLRTIAGQVLTVNFPSLASLSVLDIKERTEQIHSIPVSFQRLIFGGREVGDSEKLALCGIEDGCMIHLLLRQTDTHAQVQNELHVANVIVPVALAPNNATPGAAATTLYSYTDAMGLAQLLKAFLIIECVILTLWLPSNILYYITMSTALVAYIGLHCYNPRLAGWYFAFIGFCIVFRVVILVEYAGDLLINFITCSCIAFDIMALIMNHGFMRVVQSLTDHDLELLRAIHTRGQ